MLQAHDIRETRVYREAKDQGWKEGFEAGFKEGFEEGIKKGAALARLSAANKSVEEIAAILELDAELIRRTLAEVESLLSNI